MKSKIKTGMITKYGISPELTIQYRGITIPLYDYKDKEQFKKNDIYYGFTKKANVVCRIMPVNHDGLIKWVGIYTKSAIN
jgi:hypothetical protein